jgi:hypothetical protein
MEVHHHSSHSHGDKKIKQYFIEFVMIFLAVSLGFLAESLREHLSDRSKETEYIGSMINNLKTDTLKLGHVVDYYVGNIRDMDSFLVNFSLLEKGFNSKSFIGISQVQAGYVDFIYTDPTMQQLKTAGGMRYIRNLGAIDSMMDYDTRVKSALINEGVLSRLYEEVHRQLRQLYRWQILVPRLSGLKTQQQVTPVIDALAKENPDMLLTHDPARLGEFYNLILDYVKIQNLMRAEMKALKKQATRLIAYLRLAYHIKD